MWLSVVADGVAVVAVGIAGVVGGSVDACVAVGVDNPIALLALPPQNLLLLFPPPSTTPAQLSFLDRRRQQVFWDSILLN